MPESSLPGSSTSRTGPRVPSPPSKPGWWNKNDRNIFDLRLRTNASTGFLAPGVLMQECKNAGLEVVSIIDRDTVDGVLEARPIAQELGLQLIPGCEISAGFELGGVVHILAYWIKPLNKEFTKLLDGIAESHRRRHQQIIQRLQECGFVMDLDTAANTSSGMKNCMPLRQMAALVLSELGNEKLLANFEVETVDDFLQRLVAEGCPAYVRPEYPPAKDVISTDPLRRGLCGACPSENHFSGGE